LLIAFGLPHHSRPNGGASEIRSTRVYLATPVSTSRVKYWEIIADNPSKAGWSWGCVSAIDSNGQTIWIADAHRDDGKRKKMNLFPLWRVRRDPT
jgi:hypothetical protein